MWKRVPTVLLGTGESQIQGQFGKFHKIYLKSKIEKGPEIDSVVVNLPGTQEPWGQSQVSEKQNKTVIRKTQMN